MTAGLRIRRNVITTVAAFFVNIALTFVGYRLAVQQGGSAALGLWAALTASIYVIRLGDVGMGSATERHVAAIDARVEPDRARTYLDTAVLLNGVLFLVLAMLGWAILSGRIEWVVPSNPAAQAEALRILPLMLTGFVVANVANVVTGGLRGLHLAYLAAYLSVLGGLVQMGVVIFLVPRLGIEGLAWGQLVQNLLIGLAAWGLFNRHVTRHAVIRPPLLPSTGSLVSLRELFGFSIRAQAVNFANGLFEPASKLIVGHSAGMSVLGIFEMAYKIVALPRNAVVSGVLGMTPAMTRLMAANLSEARRLYQRARRMVALSTAAVLLVVVASSPLASAVLLGQVDRLLLTFVTIIALGFWLNTLGAPAYSLGFAAGRMGANLVSALLSLGVVLTAGQLFQIYWPVHGPVTACAVGLAIGGLFILWRNQRLLSAS